jgi:hypothetical protein
MAMAQQVMPDVAATEPDESRSTAAVLPLRSASDRAESTERLHGWLGLSSLRAARCRHWLRRFASFPTMSKPTSRGCRSTPPTPGWPARARNQE